MVGADHWATLTANDPIEPSDYRRRPTLRAWTARVLRLVGNA